MLRRDPATYLVGTSGWHYADWRGEFYPRKLPSSQWLAYYASTFSTVELNASFYRQPTDKAYTIWKEGTPASFKFSLKASRFITHMKKMSNVGEPLQRFFQGASLLGEKLSAVLYQLPPQLKRNDELLHSFLQQLKPGVDHALEFRNESWFNRSVYGLLSEYHAGFCIMDMPGLTAPLQVTADFAYIRFHGSHSLYSSNYTDKELKEWAAKIKELKNGLRNIYIYFNNDMHGYAIKNAVQLQKYL